MEPGTEGGRGMDPIPMLEPQYQVAAPFVVAEYGTGPGPGRRVTDARPADAVGAIAALVELEGIAASLTDRRRYEGDLHPACGAKCPYPADDGAALKALMGKQQVDNPVQRRTGGR